MNKPCIVMIEDNPGEVELLRLALDQQGEPYDLVVFPDGAAALKFVYQRHAGVREPAPCAVLLDVHLPKYDGLEVLAALRREPLLRHIPVVMLSSGEIRTEEEDRIQALDAVFRQKPSHFSGVLQLAADVLELCKKAMSLA
jgi:CheY-like chemotaxis protein